MEQQQITKADLILQKLDELSKSQVKQIAMDSMQQHDMLQAKCPECENEFEICKGCGKIKGEDEEDDGGEDGDEIRL